MNNFKRIVRNFCVNWFNYFEGKMVYLTDPVQPEYAKSRILLLASLIQIIGLSNGPVKISLGGEEIVCEKYGRELIIPVKNGKYPYLIASHSSAAISGREIATFYLSDSTLVTTCFTSVSPEFKIQLGKALATWVENYRKATRES